jgi:hypothetical protein
MFDLGLYKEAASAAAFILTIALFVPYIRSIRNGSTVPHVFSWLIWSFGTLVVFFAQLTGGAGLGAWPIGFSACITGYIAFLAYTKSKSAHIAKSDWYLLALAGLAVPAWALTSDPLWAVILLTTADLIGFAPTIRKGYSRPFEEHAGFFALGSVRNSFVIIALERYSWTTALFPAAVGIACLMMAGFLIFRRQLVVKQEA